MAFYPIPDQYVPISGVPRPYERGTWVGLSDATRAELDARAANVAARVDVLGVIPGSTKRVAGHMRGRTTATLTSGSNSIVVADGSEWRVGYCLVLGMVAKCRVTGGATASGDITIALHSHQYAATVAAGDTAAQVATKIAGTATRGTTSAPVDNGDGSFTVTFRLPTAEYFFTGNSAGFFDIRANSTGVVFAENDVAGGNIRLGVVYTGGFFEVASVSGNTLGLTPINVPSGKDGNIGYTGSNVIVRHDDGPAIQAFINGLSDGQVLKFEPTYEHELHTSWNLNRSNITVLGSGARSYGWGYAGSPATSYSIAESAQTLVTGGKNRGSQILTVDSSAGYAVGQIRKLYFGNDYTLPVMSGYDTNDKDKRGGTNMFVKITSVPDGTHIGIDRPLPHNWSGVWVFVSSPITFMQKSSLEGIIHDAGDSQAGDQGGMYGCYECRWKDVKVSRGSNRMCGMSTSFRSEWQKVFLDRIPGFSSNKFGVGWNNCTGCFIEDTILYSMVNLVQGNSGLMWCAMSASALIVSTDGSSLAGAGFTFNHGAQPMFVCVEGCWVQASFVAEGYHGGTSNHLIFRNHIGCSNGTPGTFVMEDTVGVDIRAKCRHILVMANQLQDSAFNTWVNDGIDPNGFPNYNRNTNGGTSTGNDWPDLVRFLNAAVDATITPTGPESGRITTTTDYFLPKDQYGYFPEGGTGFTVILDKQYRYSAGTYVDARTLDVFGPQDGAPLTLANVRCELWPVSGQKGFQEKDLSTEATTLRVANTSVFSGGMPEIDETNLGAYEVQDSLIYASRPTWLDEAEIELGVPFEWPAFGWRPGNPNFRNESLAAIPAGVRFTSTLSPVFSSAQINAAGTQLSLAFNKPVTFGAGGSGGVVISNALDTTVATYLSGAGTPTLVYSLSRVVLEAEIELPRVAYTQPGAGIVDNLNNAVESWLARLINNSSTQVGSVTEILTLTGPEDTDTDTGAHPYGAFGQIINVPALCTANKIRAYISGENGQPPYNGPRVALFRIDGANKTKLTEGNLNYTGVGRYCSADLTPPVELTPGDYMIAIRPTGSGPHFRTKATGSSFILFSGGGDDGNNFFNSYATPSAVGAPFYNFTWLVGLRVVLAVEPPAAPSGLTADAVSSTQINLGWNDESDDETGFKVEMAVGAGAFALIHTTAANVESYAVTGLTAGQTYRFRVSGTNSGGDSDPSNEATEDTLPPTPPPAAPTFLTAIAASQTRIDLAWVDESDDETGFKVEMAVGGGAFALIHTTAANVESYAVTGLTAGETYRFRIKATNLEGDSSPSNEDTETTPPIVPPTTPTTSPLGFTLTPTVGELHTRGLTRWRFNGIGWTRA